MAWGSAIRRFGCNANRGDVMASMGISRRVAVAVVCGVAALTAPTGAMALTTHSATTSTVNANGFLTATASCGANQRVVSGGYKTSLTDPSGAAVISHAVKGTERLKGPRRARKRLRSAEESRGCRWPPAAAGITTSGGRVRGAAIGLRET